MDVFRKDYGTLTDKQKDAVLDLKTVAQGLLTVMNVSVPSEERSERSRCMAIARTNLEQAIMWAVKGVTTPAGQ